MLPNFMEVKAGRRKYLKRKHFAQSSGFSGRTLSTDSGGLWWGFCEFLDHIVEMTTDSSRGVPGPGMASDGIALLEEFLSSLVWCGRYVLLTHLCAIAKIKSEAINTQI